MAREERRSPLLEMFPTVDIMLDPDSELHADINCLLATLLPFGRSDALNRRGPLAYAFVISKSWKVSQIRPSRWKQAWRDESALKGRLDELVAANQIRALGTCERVELRRSTGLQDARELAIHILIEHRDRFSTDFLVPLEWAPVRKPWVSEPAAVDRVATGRPHRLWPGVEDLDREPAFAERAEEAFEDYSKYGIYEELHRAIDLASAALESLDAADPDYPDAADRLARFLAARFRHSGYTDDLEEATRLSRLAVDGDSSSPGRRARLGDTLGLRFISEGRIADLEDGMDEARGAYSSAVNSADRFECAEILADLLLTHYRATAERASLREVSTLVDSVAPVMEQERGTVSAELAASLATMCLFVYAANGIALNVEWAVKWSKWAIEATPKKAPSYARRLRDHGIALSRSYEITKDESQLAEAYACLDAALRRTHGDAPERRSIQLARAAARVHRLAPERLNGLRKAVDADRRTIEADEIAVDPHSPFSQNLTLMQAFQLEAERASFRLSDDEFASAGLEPVSQFLSLAVISVEDVFRSLPDNSPERPNVLALLATLYRDRFEGSGDLTQLRMAADAAAQGAVEWAALFAVAPVAQKLGASASGAELYDIAVDALLELAELDKSTAETAHGRAFLLVEAAKARLLTEQLSRGELAPPPGVPAKLLARERSLLKEIEALDSAALAARDSGIPVRTHGERRADLTQQLNEVWDAIAKQDGAAVEYVTTRRGETPTLESIHDVVANAGLGRAVLSLFILRSRTVLFSARAGGSGYLVFQVSVGSDGWRDALRRFNRELPRSGGQDVLPPTWEAPLRPVLQLAGELVKGAWYVTIVPHGPASALPWTYLTRDWEGADEQQPAISTIPSLAMLARLQRRPRVAPGKPVVIGNPTGDLEYAEAEARATGAILGVEPLIGSVATRSALDEAAPTARTLHLACHAAFEEASPLDSHILLADGPWRAREALSLDLDAELVILSGCETGLLGSLAGEEAAGLAQAFLHAGARSVIVSLWPVSDAATAEFMRVFHTHRAAGERVSVGLRAAATEVRCSHPHPWFWSGFLLVGADH